MATNGEDDKNQFEQTATARRQHQIIKQESTTPSSRARGAKKIVRGFSDSGLG